MFLITSFIKCDHPNYMQLCQLWPYDRHCLRSGSSPHLQRKSSEQSKARGQSEAGDREQSWRENHSRIAEPTQESQGKEQTGADK